MRRSVGRAFPVTRKQVKSLDHVSPKGRRMRRNPGVTTIAAINGRGAYRGVRGRGGPLSRAPGALRNRGRSSARPAPYVASRSVSARRLMSNTSSRGQRVARARTALTQAQRRAFANKVRARLNASSSRSTANRARVKKRTTRSVTPKRRKRTMSKRLSPKALAAARRNLRKARAAKRHKARGSAPKRRRKRRAKSAAPKRRKRRTRMKANPRRRRRARRNSWKGNKAGHAAAARKGWRKRRRTKAAAPKRRKRRSKARKTTTRRKRSRTTRRTRARKGKRKLSRKKSAVAARRRRRAARAGLPTGELPSVYRKNRRRKRRKTARRNRRHTANSRRSSRRGHRRNAYVKNSRRRGARRRHRRNPFGPIGQTVMNGLVAFGGFVGHRVATNLLKKYVVDKFLPAPAPAAAGIGALDASALMSLGTSVVVAGAELFLVNKVVKDREVKVMAMAGVALSTLQQLIVAGLRMVSMPTAADVLSGYDDSTASRISAMYGLRGTSIMPRYAPIGEYFSSGVNGVGEYFSSGVQGLGGPPYQAAAGMGQYGPNPDIYQAAAGFGAHDNSYGHTNSIDPSSNLDRELSIAEAAAGVGALPRYEASAGMGEYFASGMRGLGNVETVPSESTWIPGESGSAQLWAGVRPIDEPQGETEMLPAGILETSGGAGIFG